MVERERWNAFLLFGMPGSGKGTQGRALGSVPGYVHIATGDIFRQLNRLGQLGREVDRHISQGKLVPDDLTLQILRNHLQLMQKQKLINPDEHTLILDGFPRTYNQAALISNDVKVRLIFSLRLGDENEAVRRIRDRALAEHRTDDADETVIRDRLVTFREQTASTLSYFPSDLVKEVDASRSAIQVLHELTGLICALDEMPAAR